MERGKIPSPLKFRSIERDIILLFPIIEMALGISAAFALFSTSPTWAAGDIFARDRSANWFIILTVGSMIGFLTRRNLYIYYSVVSIPLQILAIQLLSLSITESIYGALEISIIVLICGIASAVFAGKIIPSDKVWIL